MFAGGLHVIPEGYVAVYFSQGRLLNSLGSPGFSSLIPYLQTYELVQVSVQTDEVTNIPCGTSGGVMVNFAKIEVVNRLSKSFVVDTIRNYTINYDHIWIYDKIHHEINQFCSHHSLREVTIDLFDTLDESLMDALQEDCRVWAPGIEILAIRVTKPEIPAKIRKAFEDIESERVRLMMVIEQQRTLLQQREVDKQQKIAVAQSSLEVSKVHIHQMIQEKKNELEISRLKDKSFLEEQKSQADGQYYKMKKELETLQEKLSELYLQYLEADALTSNLKVYFGDSIPDYINSNEAAALLPRAMKEK